MEYDLSVSKLPRPTPSWTQSNCSIRKGAGRLGRRCSWGCLSNTIEGLVRQTCEVHSWYLCLKPSGLRQISHRKSISARSPSTRTWILFYSCCHSGSSTIYGVSSQQCILGPTNPSMRRDGRNVKGVLRAAFHLRTSFPLLYPKLRKRWQRLSRGMVDPAGFVRRRRLQRESFLIPI